MYLVQFNLHFIFNELKWEHLGHGWQGLAVKLVVKCLHFAFRFLHGLKLRARTQLECRSWSASKSERPLGWKGFFSLEMGRFVSFFTAKTQIWIIFCKVPLYQIYKDREHNFTTCKSRKWGLRFLVIPNVKDLWLCDFLSVGRMVNLLVLYLVQMPRGWPPRLSRKPGGFENCERKIGIDIPWIHMQKPYYFQWISEQWSTSVA